LNKLGLGDSGAAKLAKNVLAYATEATGSATPEAALEKFNNYPEATKSFKNKILENEHVLKKLAFEDRKDARQMYQVHHNQADIIADRVMKWNLYSTARCTELHNNVVQQPPTSFISGLSKS
jgi:hypothetical protein